MISGEFQKRCCIKNNIYMKKIIFILILAPSVLLSQWVNVNHYWNISIFEGIDIVDTNTIYVSGVEHVLKSTNGGANWFSVLFASETFIRDVYFINLNTGFIIRTLGGGLQFKLNKTTNGGLNWYGVLNNSIGGYIKRIDMVDSLYGYAACENDVYKTTDGGNNWFACYHSMWFDEDGFGLDFINRDTGYYGVSEQTFGAVICKTTNGGSNWIFYDIHDASFITGISMCNSNTGYAISTGTIYKTTNGSFDGYDVQFWFGVGSSMWDITAVNPDTVYISAWQGIIKTNNGGLNWYIYPTGNNSMHGLDMLNSTTGYAVGTNRPGSTNGVIYKTTNGGYVIGIEPIKGSLPNKYYLIQNYPNPFNASTQIKFELPKRSYVKIIIYDIQGKIIDKLADNNLDAGKFYINWEAGKYSSGIYFCKMITEDFTDTKRMVLVK